LQKANIKYLNDIKDLIENEETDTNNYTGYSVRQIKHIMDAMDANSDEYEQLSTMLIIYQENISNIDTLIENMNKSIELIDGIKPGDKIMPDAYPLKTNIFDLGISNGAIQNVMKNKNVTEQEVMTYIVHVNVFDISFDKYIDDQHNEYDDQPSEDDEQHTEDDEQPNVFDQPNVDGTWGGISNSVTPITYNNDENVEPLIDISALDASQSIPTTPVLDKINMENHFFNTDVVKTTDIQHIVNLIKLTSFKDEINRNSVVSGYELMDSIVTDSEVLRIDLSSDNDEIILINDNLDVLTSSTLPMIYDHKIANPTKNETLLNMYKEFIKFNADRFDINVENLCSEIFGQNYGDGIERIASYGFSHASLVPNIYDIRDEQIKDKPYKDQFKSFPGFYHMEDYLDNAKMFPGLSKNVISKNISDFKIKMGDVSSAMRVFLNVY